MGFDLYGRKPKSKSGKYFRSALWEWPVLHALISETCDDLLTDDELYHMSFNDGYAFSANGRDGNITMVGETSPGKFEPVATITTLRGARTIASDQKAHKLYLPSTEPGPPQEGKDGKKGVPTALPDSFEILVVGR